MTAQATALSEDESLLTIQQDRVVASVTLIEALGLAQLLDRLDERLRLLTSANRAVAARQRSLEAAVDWSYQLLSEPEQRVFRVLSVFPGSFTLDAAEAVADAADGFDVVGSLAEFLAERADVHVDRAGQRVGVFAAATVEKFVPREGAAWLAGEVSWRNSAWGPT